MVKQILKTQKANQSRRDFLKLKWSKSHKKDGKIPVGTKSKKMLMADGTLVEIDLSTIDRKAIKKKASNREILDWMTGPQFDSK